MKSVTEFARMRTINDRSDVTLLAQPTRYDYFFIGLLLRVRKLICCMNAESFSICVSANMYHHFATKTRIIVEVVEESENADIGATLRRMIARPDLPRRILIVESRDYEKQAYFLVSELRKRRFGGIVEARFRKRGDEIIMERASTFLARTSHMA